MTFIGRSLIVAFTLLAGGGGCKQRKANQDGDARVKRHFGREQYGLLEHAKMGLYRSERQYCSAQPEFHIKPEEKHAPWDPIYGFLCLDLVTGRTTLHDAYANVLASAEFGQANDAASGAMGGGVPVDGSGGSAPMGEQGLSSGGDFGGGLSNSVPPQGDASAGKTPDGSRRVGKAFVIRDAERRIMARLNEDENWTVKNLVQKTFRISDRNGNVLANSTRLPFQIFRTVFDIKTPKEIPVARIWSHFWNWTVHDQQGTERIFDRRVLYMLPAMHELKHQLDSKRRQQQPPAQNAGAKSPSYWDDGSSTNAGGYAPPANTDENWSGGGSP